MEKLKAVTGALAAGGARRGAVAALLFALWCGLPARAYDEQVHALITRRALAGRAALREAVAPARPADLDALRARFWRTAAALPDAGLRAEFLRRFPEEARFDAWSFKQLLQLDPAARVHGFDPVDDRPRPALDLLADASRWPDDDERNRHRYARDPRTRAILRDASGAPLPDDPATLDFGGLTGTTSQAHAHYGLVRGPLSDDPEVLRKDPRRFAVPPTAHALGPELAGVYTDLALFAAASGLPGSAWVARVHEGAAFHHLEDVCNQIHTVQVGIYAFFESAFLQSRVRDLETLGGLLGPRWPLREVGVRLIANHHLMSEALFADALAQAESGAPDPARLLAAPEEEDAALREAMLRAIAEQGWPGKAMADALVDASGAEGPEVYRLAWTFSAPTLRSAWGHEYADGDDPRRFVAQGDEARRARSAFDELQRRGLRRAGTALRLWEDERARELSRPRAEVEQGAVRRVLAFALPRWRAAEVRRAAYRPAAAGAPGIAWGYPLAALALVAGLVALARFAARRRRR